MKLNSDKRTCIGKNVTPATHKCNGYKCHSTANMCIPKKSVCDGIPDCPEHDDETSCHVTVVTPLKQTVKSSSTTIYIIIGAVVGLLLFIILLVVLGFLYRKRRTRFELR